MNLHGGNLSWAAEKYGLDQKNIIDFSASINPLGQPKGIKKIISSNFDATLHYPDTDCRALKKKFSTELNIPQECILFGNGSIELIFAAMSFLKPKTTLIPVPTFSEYERAVCLSGGDPVFLNTGESDNFEIKIDKIIKYLNKVNAIFICNPNNPTGFLFKKEALEFLIRKCEKKGVFLIVDEAFMDFVDKKDELSLISLAYKRKHVLVLRSLTKFFAVAGLRLGYLTGEKSLIKNISCHQFPWSVNSLAQIVGEYIIGNNDYIKKSREYIKKQRITLANELETLGTFKVYPASANFIFCKILNASFNVTQLCNYCAKRGVLIRDCSNFRGLDDKFIRIAVRNKNENKKLISVLRNYPG